MLEVSPVINENQNIIVNSAYCTKEEFLSLRNFLDSQDIDYTEMRQDSCKNNQIEINPHKNNYDEHFLINYLYREAWHFNIINKDHNLN